MGLRAAVPGNPLFRGLAGSVDLLVGDTVLSATERGPIAVPPHVLDALREASHGGSISA